MKKSLNGRTGHYHIGSGKQHGLAYLVIPRPHGDRQALIAVEARIAEDEITLLCKLRRARAQRRLYHHFYGDPRGPVSAIHASAAGLLIEARIDLGRTVVLPGPMPRHRLEVDAPHH